MGKLVREPLLHFALAAVLIGGLHRWHARNSLPEIRVTREQADALARDLELQTGRKPDKEERAALISQHVAEEILFREALKEGREQDPRVRRLLALSLREALEPVIPDPTDAQLEELRAQDPAAFRFPAGASFSHVSFPSADEVPAGLLEKLRAGEKPASAPGMHLPDPLPQTWMPQIERMFGSGFAEALAACKPGEWTGPLASARGVHFVKILNYAPPRDMPLEAVRPALATKWITERQKAAVSAKVEEMKKGYRIRLPDEPRDVP